MVERENMENISHASDQNYMQMIKLLGDKSTIDRKKKKTFFHRSHHFIVKLIATEYCGGHMHKWVLKSDYTN